MVLQCAGNDVDNGHSVAQVVQQLDSLINDIKSCCPTADIIVNKIPPRGHNNKLLETIDIVNKYISAMSQAKNSRVFSSDACPKSYSYYLKTKYILITKVNNFMPRKCWKYYIFPGCLSSKKGKDHCHSIKLHKWLWNSWYWANFQSAFRWLILEIVCHQQITRRWSLPFTFCYIWYEKPIICATYMWPEWNRWAHSSWNYF